MTDSRDLIARYVKMRAEKPIRGLDPDHVAGMHLGTEWEAELRVSDLAALLAENEMLTARLRDLVNAEPVRWLCPDDETTASCECERYNIPLIRRPEMPS